VEPCVGVVVVKVRLEKPVINSRSAWQRDEMNVSKDAYEEMSLAD
jgi:hypothetical protein